MKRQAAWLLGVAVVSFAACDRGGTTPGEEPRASFSGLALEQEDELSMERPLAGTLEPLPGEPRQAFISRAHLRIEAYEQFLRVLEHGAPQPREREAIERAKREVDESKREFAAFQRASTADWGAPAETVTRSVTRLDSAFARAWREGGNR